MSVLIPLQAQVADIPGALHRGYERKRIRMEDEHTDKVRGALEDYYGSDTEGILNAHAPGVMQAEANRKNTEIERQRADTEYSQSQQDRTTERVAEMAPGLKRVADDLLTVPPEQRMEVFQQQTAAMRQAYPEFEEMFAAAEADGVFDDNELQSLSRDMASLVGPEGAEKQSNRALMAQEAGLQPGTPEFQEFILKDTAPTTTVNINPDEQGAVELDKTTSRKQIDKVIGAGESLARLDRIQSNYDPSFLTLGGKARNFLSQLKDKATGELSPEERQALGQHRRFTQGVNFEFNAYRKLITGAAAQLRELEDLKKAMISTDLGPNEFEAAFDEYRNELGRSMRIGQSLVREGLKPGTTQFAERSEQMFMTGGDGDMEARGDELMEQLGDAEKVLDQLEREGYTP